MEQCQLIQLHFILFIHILADIIDNLLGRLLVLGKMN